MKTAIIAAALTLLAPAWAAPIKIEHKCQKSTGCHHGPPKVAPVETGKGSCKAHPGSCK